jgi:hypothetical protein
MLERLMGYFLIEPRRLVALGAALVRVGGFLFVAGLVGQAATTAVSAVKGLAGTERVDVPLAYVLPDYLSFWMPESALGFSLALLLLATGLVVTRTGRVYERFMGT